MTLPDLPLETAEAALAAFPGSNVYLLLGHYLPVLFTGLDLPALEFDAYPTTLCGWRHALITVFQYQEEITDQQAASTAGCRLDWKYALHLPLAFSGCHPAVLFEFRTCLLGSTSGLVVFKNILDRLVAKGFFDNLYAVSDQGQAFLRSVNSLSLNQQLSEQISRVIEAMATKEPDFLRRIVKPHWYIRYRRGQMGKELPGEPERQLELSRSIRADALYLLRAVQDANEPRLNSLLEVQSLELICQDDLE